MSRVVGRTEEPGVKSFARGLDVLVAILREPRRFEELAAEIRIPRSSLYRFLAALEARGLVRRDTTTKRYLPGLRLYQLRRHSNHGLDRLRHTIRDQMPRLVERIGESIYLYVRDGADRVCIERLESRQQPIKHIVAPGSRFPLYAGASGKVILAFLPQHERARVLHGRTLRKLGPRTVTSAQRLERELGRIRQQGYAYSEQEVSSGAWALAVPVFDDTNACVASLAVAGPVFRLHRDQIADYARSLRKAIEDVQADAPPAVAVAAK